VVDNAFYNWLSDAYHEKCLTREEIDKAIANWRDAYNLLEEFVEHDKTASGRMAQKVVIRFKNRIGTEDET
jgi:hypothetical protein